ncbi:hypothetical protein CKO28_25920 [Rhodovibrio sodomensis]|uniref:Alpha-carbonic anhydrase domain-containing protein n=1 Tax=Rhodovibrio sodomensis TaxID=1088 RepID=A0ABS1DN53_9PROT|nr:hypothetical protein [Rhodovibrio sodomensis]
MDYLDIRLDQQWTGSFHEHHKPRTSGPIQLHFLHWRVFKFAKQPADLRFNFVPALINTSHKIRRLQFSCLNALLRICRILWS